MSKKVETEIIEAEEVNQAPVSNDRKYSKLAFIEGASNSKDRLILNVILDDNKTYSKAEVESLVKDWKSKQLKELKPKEVNA